MNSDRLSQALEKMLSVVGSENLITQRQQLEELSKDIIPETQLASGYIFPGNLDELKQILAIACEFQISLWPVSQGKNWGYGGSSPVTKGSLVVNLSRLNKIIEVHTELAYAVIEPGVTFRQLHQYLVDQNLQLWIDCTDGPPDGSVMGNSLERGVGETDYGDHFGNICGMEVLLPNGDLIRTGGGPFENFRSWNTYKWGLGPYIEGLFSQSNFGIVTKIGVWLRPKPEYFTSCIFELNDKKNFPKLIDSIRTLQLSGTLVSKIHLINDTATIAVTIEDFNNPQETLNGYQFSSWSFAAGVYGNKDQVKSDIKQIKKILSPLGKLDFIDQRIIFLIQKVIHTLRGWQESTFLKIISNLICKKIIGKPLTLLEVLPHVHAIEQGYPSDYFVRHAYLKSKTPKPKQGEVNPVKDNCGLIWLGPMVPMIGAEMQKLNLEAERLYKKFGFDMYIALMIANPRTGIALFSIFFDKTNVIETQLAKELYFALGELIQNLGYQQYRTSTLYMNQILSQSPEYKKFCDNLKKAIDPQGILAPGKYGI